MQTAVSCLLWRLPLLLERLAGGAAAVRDKFEIYGRLKSHFTALCRTAVRVSAS